MNRRFLLRLGVLGIGAAVSLVAYGLYDDRKLSDGAIRITEIDRWSRDGMSCYNKDVNSDGVFESYCRDMKTKFVYEVKRDSKNEWVVKRVE